jgi:glycogen operon protein
MVSEHKTRVWPGRSSPLGATWDGQGVNFAVFSAHATSIELCLFESPESPVEFERIPLNDRTGDIWHCYLPDARPGWLYGYRAHGTWSPEIGLRFNPHKLLIDPYAKGLSGRFIWDDAVYAYPIGSQYEDKDFDDRDSAPFMPRSMVIDTAFTWGDDRAPNTPWNRTVIYEAHVKGLTATHPDVPENIRGTYLGLASEPIIDHLTSLGVTAIELLPTHAFLSERALGKRQLSNYWGYNSIGFFAPHAQFASNDLGEQVSEFKTMVKKLHRAGIEVILDVVYNHTAEGDHLGPTLSMRGLDNLSYYHLVEDDKHHYMNYTGCGNSINAANPDTMRLIMDSLRYWVTEMHVDGFRFDLAPVLGRGNTPSDPFGRFFDIVRQDPVLAGTKLIAEPWDVGEDGYKLGDFPPGWAEWNGSYRDCVRRFWQGSDTQLQSLASRLSGSSDLYRAGPNGSINFITCHDGFTLHDLVTYEEKHNLANGEENADGHNDNASNNWGHEGETDSEQINALRARMKRNLMATLILSQGVPMLSAGDEMGRTQNGNNNAYCQDNELAWLDWNLSARDRDFLQFCRHLLAIHRENPALRRHAFFHGQPISDGNIKDVTWVRADGQEMREGDWARNGHTLGMLMHGHAADEKDERGILLRGDTLLLLLNGGGKAVRFRLPEVEGPGSWVETINTTTAKRLNRALPANRKSVHLQAHALILMRHGASW